MKKLKSRAFLRKKKYVISEAKILNFLGETEQNEYIVQNYYMSIRELDGVTYLKELLMY